MLNRYRLLTFGNHTLPASLVRDVSADCLCVSPDFPELTHLSAELEYFPTTKICPSPAFHLGAGGCQDEPSNTEFGYNIGASLGLRLSNRVKLLTRNGFRSVDGLSRDYLTIRIGLRFRF